MNTIHRNDLNKEIEKLMNLKVIPTNKKLYTKLNDLGYTYEELGTGKSSSICSHNIAVMNIASRYYLNGEFLVFGLCNLQYLKKGKIYRVYVKQIID